MRATAVAPLPTLTGTEPHLKLGADSSLEPMYMARHFRFTRPEPDVLRLVHGLFNERSTHARGAAVGKESGTAGQALDFELRLAGVLVVALLCDDEESPRSVAQIQDQCAARYGAGEVLRVLQTLVDAGLLKVLEPVRGPLGAGRQKKARRS